MGYKIKEIYYTLQGEGAHAGRPAVFLRFSGCNLWSGREIDRSKAICKFCDTDFFGMDGILGGKYSDAEALSETVNSLWPERINGSKYIVCTGGEPYLQLDSELVDAFQKRGFEVGVETNGTLIGPDNVDWICVSPKANTEIVLQSGNEIKLVFPQKGISPENFTELSFDHFFIQPMDGPFLQQNIREAIKFCLENPIWKLSLQTHKMIGIS